MPEAAGRITARRRRTGIAAVLAALLALLLPAAAIAGDCNGDPPDVWLAGSWQASGALQTLTIRREGAALTWSYDRQAGVNSEKWGDKVPAAGAGRVVRTDGCRAVLTGIYTRYDGRGARGREPVGSPLSWKLLLTAPDDLASEGMGYGQAAFRVLWHRAP